MDWTLLVAGTEGLVAHWGHTALHHQEVDEPLQVADLGLQLEQKILLRFGRVDNPEQQR